MGEKILFTPLGSQDFEAKMSEGSRHVRNHSLVVKRNFNIYINRIKI